MIWVIVGKNINSNEDRSGLAFNFDAYISIDFIFQIVTKYIIRGFVLLLSNDD